MFVNSTNKNLNISTPLDLFKEIKLAVVNGESFQATDIHGSDVTFVISATDDKHCTTLKVYALFNNECDIDLFFEDFLPLVAGLASCVEVITDKKISYNSCPHSKIQKCLNRSFYSFKFFN